MKAQLSLHTPLNSEVTLALGGSKSESNRLLILQALFPSISMENLSNSDDSAVMQEALAKAEGTIDIHHAGTAMRFLTAYFASRAGTNVVLTGSDRMRQRPIGVLVEALRSMGASIVYTGDSGCPPLQINGSDLAIGTVMLEANISSQYITALMLIAPSLPNGLRILLRGKVTSVPYIEMTRSLLEQCGIRSSFVSNEIVIAASEEVKDTHIVVESDWSSASYFYSFMALSLQGSITLGSFRSNSFQGDSALAQIYEQLGVHTEFLPSENKIRLSRNEQPVASLIELDLSNTPDIAQTIAVSCFGLGIECYLTGLHTLMIKETDRLTALKTELEKLGGRVAITEDSLRLFAAESIPSQLEIETYNDHRMAMAFAPLALKTDITIKDCGVVSKSYPSFWEDMKHVGLQVDMLG
ncbi:MAG: 3-phosphoshikimate 1-carboxyvinyltransferase [Bacteroidota bacterium]